METLFFGSNYLNDEENRINNRIYYKHGKVHNSIVLNPFKQITTFLEVSNWFWITLCYTFQLFSCSVFLVYIYIYIYILMPCSTFIAYSMWFIFLNIFHFFNVYIVYIIHRKRKTKEKRSLRNSHFLTLLSVCIFDAFWKRKAE